MTSTLDPVSAAEVYTVGLESRHRSRLRALVYGALDLWCANFGGTFELTRAGDVVVRRRHDGGEELRIEVDDPEGPAETLHRVREQLDDLEPEEFRRLWSMD